MQDLLSFKTGSSTDLLISGSGVLSIILYLKFLKVENERFLPLMEIYLGIMRIFNKCLIQNYLLDRKLRSNEISPVQSIINIQKKTNTTTLASTNFFIASFKLILIKLKKFSFDKFKKFSD